MYMITCLYRNEHVNAPVNLTNEYLCGNIFVADIFELAARASSCTFHTCIYK